MESSNGTTASYAVRVDSNGLIAGFGLYNDSTTSAFAVNADQFYIGDSASTLKKPFMVLTKSQTINGTTYPAGTWIDTAIIANAAIGTAHIKDASITNAKIANLSADKITTGILDANRIGTNTITAEKVTIGDATNLWLNPYLSATGSRPQAGRSALALTVPQVKGNAVRLWDRKHISPYSTKIPIQVGDTIVIEYTAKQAAGNYRALQVGLAVYDDQGGLGTVGLQYGAAVS